MLEPIKAHAATTETRMSGMGNKADKICSRRAFLFLTQKETFQCRVAGGNSFHKDQIATECAIANLKDCSLPSGELHGKKVCPTRDLTVATPICRYRWSPAPTRLNANAGKRA